MKTTGRIVVCLAALTASTGWAQTLDEQYEFYLSVTNRRCGNLNFAVDAEGALLPGQAGPDLERFCSGPPPVGGGGSTSSQGGGSSASSGGRSSIDDAALRRQRDRRRASTDSDAAPTGDLHFERGQASIFMSLDHQHEKQSITRHEAGHRSDLFAGTLGADYRIGTQALVGIAVKREDLDGDFMNDAGRFDSRGTGAALYGSWWPVDGLFVDTQVGLIDREIDTQRIVGLRRVIIASPLAPPRVSFDPPLAAARSRTNSTERNAELRIGYDFVAGRTTLGPRAAFSWKRSELDGFVEGGATPMTLVVDEQVEKSSVSSLGLQLSGALDNSAGVFVPQLNVDWMHELEDDQRIITARFAQDLRAAPGRLRYRNEAPDRDTIRVRVSGIAVLAQGVSAFVSFEELAGHTYLDRHSAAIGVRVEL